MSRIKAGRGYLLSYHRLMAAHDPALLLAYDDLYCALTLSDLALTPKQREIVWLSLLVSAGQVQGRIHLDRALALGLDAWLIAQAACLVAHGNAPDIVAPDIEPDLAQLCLAVSAASRWDGTALSFHLSRAIAGLGASAAVEALCFVMIPCGIVCLARLVRLAKARGPGRWNRRAAARHARRRLSRSRPSVSGLHDLPV